MKVKGLKAIPLISVIFILGCTFLFLIFNPLVLYMNLKRS